MTKVIYYYYDWQLAFRAQELSESRGGRPGLPIPNKPMISVDVKQHFNNNNSWLFPPQNAQNSSQCFARVVLTREHAAVVWSPPVSLSADAHSLKPPHCGALQTNNMSTTAMPRQAKKHDHLFDRSEKHCGEKGSGKLMSNCSTNPNFMWPCLSKWVRY